MNADEPTVTSIARGLVRVDTAGRQERVYVAGPSINRWAFWNGLVFHADSSARDGSSARRSNSGVAGALTLTAPMPATVLKVLVSAGSSITKGETLVLLEAMKMELPVRSLADGRVKAVHCREGELVAANQPLVDVE
jgi:biotin carboxyl carrier protein